MTMSKEEVIDIKTNIAILNKSMAEFSTAQTKNIEVQTNLAVKMGDLLMEMKERDMRDEFLREKVVQMEDRQKATIDEMMPVIRRAKASQSAWDKFKGAMVSNWGRMLSIVMVLAILYLLGLDPSKILKP